MLERTGWVDPTFMTPEGRDRGTVVHGLTAAYDLGAIEDPRSVTSAHKGYLLAHVEAMRILQLEILSVEEPTVHPVHLFGCRPDRAIDDRGRRGPLEVKSGAPEKGHPIQTALQAIALEPILLIPAELQVRLCLYLRANGRFKLEQHRDRGDFRVALDILRACC